MSKTEKDLKSEAWQDEFVQDRNHPALRLKPGVL